MDAYSGHDAAESPPRTDSPDATAGGHQESLGKRQRVSRACDPCRRKKVKCDGLRPICTHCHDIGAPCTYLDTTKKRGPPKGYIDAIENRLHAAEGLLKTLVLSDPNAARVVLDSLQQPGGSDSAGLCDSAGKLFGCMTMAELTARAAGSVSPGPAIPSTASNHRPPRAPETRPTSAGYDDSGDFNSTESLAHLEKGIGHLTLDSTGSLRYLGDSSGWYIINRSLLTSESSPRLTRGVDGAFRWPPITSIAARDNEPGGIAADLRPAASPEHPAANSGSSRLGAAAIPASAVPALAPAVGDEHVDAVSVPRNLPPSGKPPMPDVDEQISMLALYFRYVHPVFPILYKSYFIGRIFDKEKRPQPALICAVFAAASTYKAREARTKEDLARVRIQMAVHFQRAKLYLDEQYTLNSIASILTLLLMSVYEQGTMSTRSWLYSGMAIRKAYDLGLHRDVGAAKHSQMAVLSPTEIEVRQRAWWGCYMMDIMVSATLGRPTTIRDLTFDAPYPADYGEDDDELLVNSSMAADPLGGRFPQPNLGLPGQAPDPEPVPGSTRRPQVSVPAADRMRDYVALSVGESDSDNDVDAGASVDASQRRRPERKPLGVYYLDLLHILGHILTEMYTCKPHRSYIARYCLHELHSRTDRLVVLDHGLREWKAELPSVLQYPVDDILAGRPARCVYVALIHLVYYTAMILLHRPFISRLGSPHQPPSGDDAMELSDSDAEADSKHATHSESDRRGFTGAAAGASGPSARSNMPSSPLPSHSICTVSAQMISLIGQAIIHDSRIFIMPFLTFMMFTAGTMHLNNVIVAADSWIARRFLKRTLNVMSRLGAHWQVSYKCYTMLNTLVRANRIGLDQVIDDSETGVRVIKERSREIARIARTVYESRILHREQPQSARTDTASPRPPHAQAATPEPSSNCTALENAAASDSRQAAAAAPGNSGSDMAQREFRPSDLPTATARQQPSSWRLDQPRQDNTGTAPWPAAWIPGDSGQTAPAKPASPIGTKIFMLRDKLDSSGRPIVPESPYTSVNLSAPEQPPSRPATGSTAPPPPAFSNETMAGPGLALGQFVPSLEFFANADYPLGIGGPNGQASTVLSSGGVFGDAGGSSMLFSAAGSSIAPVVPAQTATASSFGGAGTVAFGGMDSLEPPRPGDSNPVGLYDESASTSSRGLGRAVHATSSDLTPARMGFSGVLIDDDVIRNLPFTGPVSYDLGLGGTEGLAARRPGEPPASDAAEQPQQQSAMPAGAGGTPWSDYVNQLIRMFNDSRDSEPRQPLL